MINTAFVFPGQGSQSVGMLADFELHYPIVLEVFAEASEVAGYNLWELIQRGPEDRLNQTEYTQVAMLTADVAVYRLLEQLNLVQPKYMAGHSLGEYPALVCAGALELKEAVRLVMQRAQIMQKSIPLGLGAMAAIVGLRNDEVTLLCQQASHEGELVTPANYNAIGQVVVAGHTPAVHRVVELALEANARLAKVIPVSVPCHCPLLQEASEAFALELAKTPFQVPQYPVVSNVDLSLYHSPEQIREKLKAQLYSPVRWVETIQFFKEQDVALILECGPGRVLSGLVKRIDRSIQAIPVYDTISLDQVVEHFS